MQLTVPEQKLLEAVEAGVEADLRCHGDGAVVRAEMLRELCTGSTRWTVQDRIRMRGGQVEGTLDLSSAHLVHPMRFIDCVFEDVNLSQARAEQPVEWDGGSATGITADRFGCDADLTIRNLTVTGTVSLRRAVVEGDLRFTGSQLAGAFGLALDGSELRVGGTLFLDDEFHAMGEVRLQSAHIGGTLCCTRGTFTDPDGCALNADHIEVENVCLDHGFLAHGEVLFTDAEVKHQLKATGGEFRNDHDGGCALNALGLKCGGAVYLNEGFHTVGQVLLRSAMITRDLDFTCAKLDGELDAGDMQVKGCLIWILGQPPKGPIDLSFASVGRLNDTRESWPDGNYELVGFKYRPAIIDPKLVEPRLDWLRQSSRYTPDSYEQLAESYRLAGRRADAELILIWSQRDLRGRGSLPLRPRMWNWFLDKCVGYGYRVHRPFVFLLIVMLISGTIYFVAQRAGLIVATEETSSFHTFYPYIYALQMIIPVIDLQQTQYWSPKPGGGGWEFMLMFFNNLVMIIGILTVLAVIPGVSRYFRGR